MPQNRAAKRPRTPTNNEEPIGHLALPSNIEPIFKTAQKINKSLAKAKHHSTFMSTHLGQKTTPQGLRPKVTFQLPDADAHTILLWEEAHMTFATSLTVILQDYYQARVLNLSGQMVKLCDSLLTKADDKQMKWMLERLSLDETKLEKELLDRRERKIGGSTGTTTRPGTPILLEVPTN